MIGPGTTGRRRTRPAAVLAGLVVLAGCGGSGRSPAPPAGSAPGRPALPPAPVVSVVARAIQPEVAVYARPRAARPVRLLSSPNRYGVQRVFLVKRTTPGWLDVYLPLRPNGSTGWVRRTSVSVVEDPYRVQIDLSRHRITVLRRGVVVNRGRIGVGRAVTPTPPGVYYLTELFRLTDPGGPWGPYGFGLSAYSDVLHEFAGADGQIGIHGTNDPGGIGSNVSHGCIRLTNPEIAHLAHLLPLGTAVRIVRT